MKNNFTHSLIKYPLLFIFILLSYNNLWSQSISEAANGINISIMNTTVAPGTGTWTTLSAITVSETVAGQIQTGTYTVSLPAGWQFDNSQNITISTSAGNIAFANAVVTPSTTTFQFTVTGVSSVASTFNFTSIKVRPTISTTSGIANMVVSAPNIAFPLHGRVFAQLSTVSGPHNAYRITGSGAATAGLPNATTIQMVDVFANTVASFTGDKYLTFTVLTESRNGIKPTITNNTGTACNFFIPIPITFTNGIMTAGGIIMPYRAESKIITCTDGTYTSSGTGGTTYPLVVSTAAHSLFTFSTISGTTHKATFSVTITATDAFLNPILTYTGTPTITVTGTAGSTISPVNPQVAAAFTAGVSVPAVNITLLGAGPLRTLTATDGAATGTSNKFTVSPANLTIIPDAGQTKVFSTANPVYTYTNSPALLGGETITGAMGRATGENKGIFAYTINTLASANYTLNMASSPNTFSITPLPVVITPAANLKVAGSLDPSPISTYVPVPNPVSTGGSLTAGTSLGRVAGETVGNYNYTLSTLSYGPNYSLSLGGANQFSIIAPAPAAGTATSVTPVSFTANWNACPGATGYHLDVSTSNTFASFMAGYENKDMGNNTTWQLTGLTANSVYYYRVRAIYSSEISPNSNMKTVYTLNIYPTAVTATNITTTGFRANWLDSKPVVDTAPGLGSIAPKGIQSYKAIAFGGDNYFLDVATDSDFLHMVDGFNNKNAATDLSCNVTGLSAGTTYYYRMIYRSSTGNSIYSNIISVNTDDEIPVIVNLGINLLNYSVKQSDLVLTDSLIIRYAGASTIQKAVITISGNYEKNDDQLIFTNSNGLAGSWDNETGILTIIGSSNPLVYETLLKTVKYRNNSVTPSTLTKEISFVVYNSRNNSNSLSRSVKVVAGNVAPVINNLERSTLSYLKGVTELRLSLSDSLVVTDSDNYNLFSATVKFAVGYLKNEDYLDFGNTSFLTGTFNQETGILTVTGKGTPANYQDFIRSVQYRNSNGVNATTSEKVFEFLINDGLVNSTTVTRSLIVKSPISTPAQLSGVILGNKVNLTWNDNASGEDGYVIQRSEGNNTLYVEIARISGNSTSYSDASIVNGQRYYYRVAVCSGTVKSDFSNEISLIGIVVGISDLNGTPKNYIISQNYPNPFNPATVIVYGIPYESQVKIQVFNSIGQLIDNLVNENKAPGYYNVRWNAVDLPSGIYFYKVNAVSIDGKNQFNEIKRMVLIK